MQNDLAAVGSTHQAEHRSNADSSRNSSDDFLKSQLKNSLATSCQAGATPPRVDVVTAIDKLHTLSQLLTDSRSSAAIEKLMTHIQKADPVALAKPGAIDKLLQEVMIAPPVVPPVPQSKKIERTHRNDAAKMGTKAHEAATKGSDVPLSQRVKSFIRFIFG